MIFQRIIAVAESTGLIPPPVSRDTVPWKETPFSPAEMLRCVRFKLLWTPSPSPCVFYNCRLLPSQGSGGGGGGGGIYKWLC